MKALTKGHFEILTSDLGAPLAGPLSSRIINVDLKHSAVKVLLNMICKLLKLITLFMYLISKPY